MRVFLKSNLSHTSKQIIILAGIVTISTCGYLLSSWLYHGIGFPLDDAWIHQTYARNLAQYGEWAFIHGQPSAGSTSPFWTGLLAIGFRLHISPYIWTYLLGSLILWSLAVLVEISLHKQISTYKTKIPWAGAFIILEWHLGWSSMSGMETLLSGFLATLVLVLIISGRYHWYKIGLLIGLSTWVRPDGITLLGPAIIAAILSREQWKAGVKSTANIIFGFSCLFIPYVLFNLWLAGTPWPNTFYAKQAEYSVLLNQSFWLRMIKMPVQLLLGAGIVLLPGFVITLISGIKKRNWGVLAAATWLAGFLMIYAWRLPVTYHYGRYIIPAMSIYLYLGLNGLIVFLEKGGNRFHWIICQVWKFTTVITLVVFSFRGMLIYARDVAIIESEMVTTARWISTNLPPGALIAAHDIGALGYFGNHNLVDMAGLVSPSVIPFLRDEEQLKTYLNDQHVNYLVTFPDWYPILTSSLTPIFTTDSVFSRDLGESNISVYRWLFP
jgi:hypothetical protein